MILLPLAAFFGWLGAVLLFHALVEWKMSHGGRSH